MNAIETVQAHPLDAMLSELASFMDMVKVDFTDRGLWTEYDQGLRDRITAYHLNKLAAAPPAAVPGIPALTSDEIAFVLNELYNAGHGHGSSKNDFEPERPSCTAADKLAALAAAPAAPTKEPT